MVSNMKDSFARNNFLYKLLLLLICFYLADAEFAVDNKCHPVPLEKAAKMKG